MVHRTLNVKACHFAALLAAVAVLLSLNSCASRCDTVWTEDGRQFGKASWYDDHGSRTANGELFNMNALTAAHPSLALNSIVEVTNLGNGRKVEVRINDRLPPIHDGRVIDLSKAAFRHLDALKVGLLDVEVRVLKYGNNKYVKVNRSAPRGKMYLPNQRPTAKQSPVKNDKSAQRQVVPETASSTTAVAKQPAEVN
ncbi:MAG: septal ring lytic transglycosylase RlpA family protein [Verrucomicrobiae bacterium]|nr:septal ring lytic transglycosylase RlpA family protein [Verrucomicrobiae bacterium]